MQIVTDERVARFVGERVGAGAVPPYTCVGIERGGQIVGGVVFNCFTGPDVEATVAGEPGAFNRRFIREIYAYVFGKLGCERVSITTEQTEIVRLSERLGGQIEGLKRHGFGVGRDAYLLGILKEDWVYR